MDTISHLHLFEQMQNGFHFVHPANHLTNHRNNYHYATYPLKSSSTVPYTTLSATNGTYHPTDKEHDTHNDHLNNSISSSNLLNSTGVSASAMHSAASSLMDSMTGGSVNPNRFFSQCSNLGTPNSHSVGSKLLLKPGTGGGMSLGLSNGGLPHHHPSANVLGSSNGGMNVLGMMNSTSANHNSSTTSGLLIGGPLSAGSLSGSSSVSSALNGGGSGKKHHVDKHSDEYKRRRERNNIAVRKSREKAKQRSRETEKKVNELYSENDSLKQKLSLVSKECRVLRQLLANYGVVPEVIERELQSSLKSDELQQQLLHQQAAGAQHLQLHQQSSSVTLHQTVTHQHLQHLQQQTNLFQQLHPAAAHFSSHNQSQHLSHY